MASFPRGRLVEGGRVGPVNATDISVSSVPRDARQAFSESPNIVLKQAEEGASNVHCMLPHTVQLIERDGF